MYRQENWGRAGGFRHQSLVCFSIHYRNSLAETLPTNVAGCGADSSPMNGERLRRIVHTRTTVTSRGAASQL